jgi:hypothetical protein
MNVVTKSVIPAAVLLLLSGCATAPRAVWARFDGQSSHASPALEQQWSVASTVCAAVAMNAANGIVAPVYQPSNVCVGYGCGQAMQQAQTNAAFANLGAGIGTAIRRDQTQTATMNACMAERGFHLVAVPEPKQ